MSLSTARWTFVALTLLTSALVVRSRTTPSPLPASASPTTFSAERALLHVREIAQRPHPSGSADHARVRDYVVAQLKALGLEPQLQSATAVGTRYPAAGHIENVLVRLPGRTPGGKAVLIAAHYDGVGAAPAAGDDGSGASAMLETLRALRAGAPLEHDVIALFSDGEEAGLLGAAAFVRDHPWAKDVEVVLDFEARGTEGRSVMFETGTGNMDVARVLATLPDVTTGSLMVTIYRLLPNDTDLSELSQLGKPALNFAFVDGVERYHTAHDDVAHLSTGSLQHHGMQMLALARAFGDGPLPRPATSDAIFFDAPFVGVVVYPEAWALPIALVAAVLVLTLLVQTARRETRWGRGLLFGAVGMVITTGIGLYVLPAIGNGLVAMHTFMGWDGAPAWRGVYAAAMALMALTLAAAGWALARRWAEASAVHAGALLVWTVLAVGIAAKLPGVSYLFAWPVLAVALAGLASAGDESPDAASWRAIAARWGATIVAGVMLIPVIVSTAGYTLPLDTMGGSAVGALVPLLAWLLAPQLEAMRGERRWASVGVLAAASIGFVAIGAASVRRNDAHPTAENLTYVTSVDADSAWLVAPESALRAGTFTGTTLGASPRRLPKMSNATNGADSSWQWIQYAVGSTQAQAARAVSRTMGDGPQADVISDSVTGDTRRLVVRFRAPSGTLGFRVNGAAYMRAVAIDGLTLDTTRYRRVPSALAVPFTAPPDSGFTVTISLPRDSSATLRLAAVSSGLPAMNGLVVPARASGTVAIQNGDVTVRYRRVDIARIR